LGNLGPGGHITVDQMQDKNHLQIADLILRWISTHVSRK
jgi:hypothetical protein